MVELSGVYQPNETDQIQAREAYVRYAIGAVTLHDPNRTQPLHAHNPEDENDRRLIVIYAESLMINGLRNVIRYAHPPQKRGGLGQVEQDYQLALPHMQATVERAYSQYADRLKKLNSDLDWLRPSPMTDEAVYKYICHGRLAKLTTLRLMDLLIPNDLFVSFLKGRTLKYLTDPDAIDLLDEEAS